MAVYVKDDFYSKFVQSVKDGDRQELDDIILGEIAKSCKERKDDMIDLMQQTGVKVKESASVAKVINCCVKNIPQNKKFRYGTSIIIADQNKIFKPKKGRLGSGQVPTMQQKEADKRFWNAVRTIHNETCRTWNMPVSNGKEDMNSADGTSNVSKEKLNDIENQIRQKAGLGEKKNHTTAIVIISILAVTAIAGGVIWYMRGKQGAPVDAAPPAPPINPEAPQLPKQPMTPPQQQIPVTQTTPAI